MVPEPASGVPIPPLAAAVTGIEDGAVVTVRVIPRAGRTQVAGTRQDAVLVRVAAAPVDDHANQTLIELLSRVLDVPRRRLHLRSSQRARLKRVHVIGLDAETVRHRLTDALPQP